MSNESLISQEVMEAKLPFIGSVTSGENTDDFLRLESKVIAQNNPTLAELLSMTFETGEDILGDFNNVHYLLGATLAYMLIAESRLYENLPTPRISRLTMQEYSLQLLAIASESGTPGFIEWLKKEAHELVPDLVEYFESTTSDDLPPEMYWGMVDVAHPFAVEAKITR